jgi:hypothetical protein
MEIRPINGPVDEATILGLVPLSHDWVGETLQQGSIEWLTDHIERRDGRVFNVWAAMCDEYGYEDPVATFERYRETRIDPFLP